MINAATLHQFMRHEAPGGYEPSLVASADQQVQDAEAAEEAGTEDKDQEIKPFISRY